MSCNTGDLSCETPRRRGALLVLAFMALIFVALSAFSFVDSRNQVTPDQFTYKGYTAAEGKQVFQAYNCMGCHTIVGNGAYFGPDLTNIYQDAGPAWLEAFLPSAGTWPTEAAVQTHLTTEEALSVAKVKSADDYTKKYKGAAERIERRGGKTTHMPNLPFTQPEVAKLIAFLQYTSAMNTEGWPPKIKTGNLSQRLALVYETSATTTADQSTETGNAASNSDLAELGEALTAKAGCTACHAADESKKVGPGWGNLYGNNVKLSDGTVVIADDAYLTTSITDSNAQVVDGYPANVMPSYNTLKADDVAAIVAYIKTLSNKE